MYKLRIWRLKYWLEIILIFFKIVLNCWRLENSVYYFKANFSFYELNKPNDVHVYILDSSDKGTSKLKTN